MNEILTSAQMRAIERAAIDSGAVSGLALMERAGAAVVAAALAKRPALAEGAHRALVMCGPGNNGGDGYVIARLLQARGWSVAVHALGDPAQLPPDARTNYFAWAALGTVRPMDDVPMALGPVPPDLIVDALFGIGLSRPLDPELGALLAEIEAWRERAQRWPLIVAVDVPSGLCADSGRVLGAALRADLTVTFHRLKLGHVLGGGPERCGEGVVVADIGLPDTPVPAAVRRVDGLMARLAAKRRGHKYDHGHALVVAGGLGRTGAARLAARGALRVGAGLVTLAAPAESMPECAAQLTAIMLRQAGDSATLGDLLLDARIKAVCLGPGLGSGKPVQDMVLTALAMVPVAPERGVVLDADALNQFCWSEDLRKTLFAATTKAATCVLTPHDGEFDRLFPDLFERLDQPAVSGPAFSRVAAARAAAARAGCVVLLKGPDTVIASPGGEVAVQASVHEQAVPWLATAGAGDVLAGMITGLMARGLRPFTAACVAAWLHAEAARHFGPGLIAEDLPEALPAVFRAQGL